MRKILGGRHYVFIGYCGVLLLIAFAFAQDTDPNKTYTVLVEDPEQVYDGDTIQDVYVIIKQFENQDFPAAVLWPGIFLKGERLYAVTDIRLAGIDTPEKRPSTTYEDGTPRPEAERQAEREAAELAREALLMLIEGNDLEFVVAEPEIGKYAGRIVADVIVDGINVSQYMIEKGLAYPYDGNTKLEFHEWYGK